MVQNKRVNWDTCQIGIPGATTKDKENRRIPFNPKGRLAAILKRRSELGPDGYVFGSANGSPPAEHPDGLGNSEATRERRRTEVRKGGSAMESGTASTDRSPLARPAARRRVPLARRRRRHPHHSADARARQHPADAALLERDRRGNAERVGSELEERRPTASPSVGKLIGLVWFPNCPRFVPRELEILVAGAGFEPATFGFRPARTAAEKAAGAVAAEEVFVRRRRGGGGGADKGTAAARLRARHAVLRLRHAGALRFHRRRDRPSAKEARRHPSARSPPRSTRRRCWSIWRRTRISRSRSSGR